jgi:UDP-N-acetylmuramoyl-tripeptide--D-alanyl-D-alanine ligase
MPDFIWLIVSALFIAAWVRPIVLTSLRALHMLQLEEYQTVRYLRWLTANRWLIVDQSLLFTGIFVALFSLPSLVIAPITAFAGIAVGVWQSIKRSTPPAKKPLVLTDRARRLLAGYGVCILIFFSVVASVEAEPLKWAGSSLVFDVAMGAIGLSLALWPLLAVANLLLYPVEAGFRRYFLASARGTLRKYHPTVIGVAGSYGKTSTKAILAHLLATRFPTLATPRSFNTPMGLCRVIREQLRPEHQFFIAELGAYRLGEIRELGRLVHPSIGVLTSVGPEHLERFGSLENVVKGEAELLQAIPPDGVAIVNGDDELCRQIANAATCRIVFAGGPAEQRRALWADDVTLTSAGLQFTISHADGRSVKARTRLLGRHSVANILLASAAALECGIAFDDLAEAIDRLEPVEHRLQLIANDNGITVIDDTYNSNPRGAAAALETLASFQGGRRYLVTPGMVELADYQDTAHREFGLQAAGVCDAVILIGSRRTRAIAEGLVAAGATADRLIITANLSEATERLRDLLRAGDAVLFENDLPDNYVE